MERYEEFKKQLRQAKDATWALRDGLVKDYQETLNDDVYEMYRLAQMAHELLCVISHIEKNSKPWD